MRGSQQGKVTTCCPITSQQPSKIESLPHRRAHHGKEPCEAMLPLAEVRCVAQQHIHQQRGPYLPADGIGAVAKAQSMQLATSSMTVESTACTGTLKR